MERRMIRILKKLYSYRNRYYGENQEPLYSEEILSDKERSVLSEYGWETNRVEQFSGHDDILDKLYSLKHNPLLSESRITAAFVAGVGGSYLRGRSALSGWICLNTIPIHAYIERPEHSCCWICGKQDQKYMLNDSEFQYILHLGNAFGDSPDYAYLNLRYLLEHEAVLPTLEDIKVFSRLLELLRTAPVDETPGKCEKRLRAAKFMPAALHLRGILHSLTLAGILPNQFVQLSKNHWVDYGELNNYGRQLKTQARSDLLMPWAGWDGSLGVDEERVEELFGEYL